ncbi:MAG: flippase-like domain-containing protein, partial [Bdellovibrionales bacterium]|nr:flippase-like domain-containing protein [Bdellovibrionales bacterium]
MKSDNGTAGFPSVETLPVVRRFTIRRCLGSRKFHSVFGIIVSIGLLVWAFSDVKIHEIEAQLLSAHYWVLIPSTLMFVFHFFIRAWRWYYLLPNGSKTSLRNRFDGIVVGCLANFILPLRAGE